MEKWRKKGCDNIIVHDVTHYTFRLWLCYLCVNCLYEAIISFFYILCSLKDFLFLSCLTKKHIEIVGEKTGGQKTRFFSKIFDFYFFIFKKEKRSGDPSFGKIIDFQTCHIMFVKETDYFFQKDSFLRFPHFRTISTSRRGVEPSGHTNLILRVLILVGTQASGEASALATHLAIL